MRKLANAELERKNINEFKEAQKTPIIVILDDIRSLHNIGSVFRTSDAFLIEKIYLCGITAVPPNKEIHKTATSCPHCGAVYGASKSRITAALLAFFLGGIGIHKFYLGKALQGFLYLIFCWTFIPAVIAFIEFVMYICMSDEKFAEKYAKA